MIRGTSHGLRFSLSPLCRFFVPFSVFFVLLTLGLALPTHGAGGSVIWEKGDAQTGKQEAKASAVDHEGNVIITGYQNLTGGVDTDYYTVKINSDGSLDWSVPFDKSGGEDKATAVAVDSFNDVIVTGYVKNGLTNDIHTIKYCGATRPGPNPPACTKGAALWQHTFVSAYGHDSATAIAVDLLNNVYVGGYYTNSSGNEDYIVLKYSPDGTLLKQMTYGSADGNDRVNSIAAGADGVAVTGHSWNGTDFDCLTIKYGFDGTPLWGAPRRYSSSGANEDKGLKVKVDSSGHVVVAGYSSNGSNKDIYTAKYNGSTGAVLWEMPYNGGYNDEPADLWVDGAGDVYITGYTWSPAESYSMFTAKYNGSDGAPLWGSSGVTFSSGNGDADDFAKGIIVDDHGDVFVIGYTHKASTGDDDFRTIKYRKDNGTLLWQQPFNGAAGKDDSPVGTGFSLTGEVYSIGWSDRWTSGASDYDYYVIKYDPGLLNAPTGLTATTVTASKITLSWTDNSNAPYPVEEEFRIYRKVGESGSYPPAPTYTVAANVTAYDDTVGLSPDTKYCYMVTAYNSANGESHNSNDACALTTVVQYSPPSWVKTYNGTGNSDDMANAIGVGPDNDPVITGQSMNNDSPPSFDYYTIKLSRVDGSRIWEARYPGDQDEGDVAVTVAVDSENKVIVSGYSTLSSQGGGQNTYDIYTVKYPALCPVLPCPPALDFHRDYKLWNDIYDGPTHNDDRSAAVATAVDGSNNVVVVGYGKNGILPELGNDDIYVMKYSAMPAIDPFSQPVGQAIPDWAATPYDGPGHGDDYPTAVAFDSSGSVFVAGYVFNGTDSDFFTAKYCGATSPAKCSTPFGDKNPGEIIWSDIFNSANGNDAAKSLAVDSSGNVYVTGEVVRNIVSGDKDFYTIKYNGETGARVWERSFNNDSTNGDDTGVSVKVDPIDGQIVVSGTTYNGAGNNDFYVIRYYPNGDVRWAKTLPRPSNDDSVVAMGMDLSGNVCVAGKTSSASNWDILSMKYSYEGTIIGATIYDGGSYDFANGVAVNNLGEAFIAGYSRTINGDDDFVIYKCAWDPLQVPSPLTATPSYTSIAIGWSDNSTAEQGFLLQRKVGGCTDADIANTCAPGDMGCPWTWSHDIPLGTVPYTSYTDAGLNMNETYCYRIQAYGDKSKGETSRWIGKSATTLVPERPSGLNATVVGTTQIDLTWTDNTDPETGFIIERCVGSDCTSPTAPASAGKGTVTYQDTGVCQNTPYTYRVKAYKTGEWETAYSEPPKSVATTTAGVSPVLTATRISEAQINLSWTDTTVEETGYEVWRKAEACGSSGLSFEKRANLPINDSFITDIDPAIDPELWNQQGVLNTTSTTPPIDMTDASGQARITASNGAVELYTKANGGGSAGTYNASQMYLNNLGGFLAGDFDIQVDFTLPDGQITASQSNVYARMKVSFPDSAGGANYIYVERIVTSSGNGYNAYSMVNGAGGTIFQAMADHTSGKLRIARIGSTITTYYWTGSAWQSYLTATISSGATDVRISQFVQRNNAVTLKTVIDNFKVVTGNTAYSDTGLAPLTTYCYKVKAFKNATCRWEVESNTADQTTTISAPSGLTASTANTTQINLSWTRNTVTEDGFIVERCMGAGCTIFAQVDGPTPTVGAGVTTYNDTAVCADNTYRYQVRAYKASWTPTTSDPSSTATAVTPAIANLLLNPSFEVSPDFTNWTTAVGTTTNTYIDTAVFYDGIKSFRLQTTTQATLGRSQAVTVTPGRQYILSGYLRTNLTQGQVQCDVQGTGIDSTGIKIVNNDLNDNDTWVFLSETVTIPSGTTSVNIRCFGDSSPRGPAYFDKLRFVPEPLISLTAARASESETLLTWTDVFTDETGFKIERCKVVPPDTSCSDFSQVNTVGSSVMFYYDAGLEPNATYRYQVRAYKTATCNGEWNSPYSNIAEAGTTIPATSLTAGTGNTTRIDLAWNDETELESETIVERCLGSGCSDFGEIDRAYRDVTNMLMLKMDEQSWSGTGLRDVTDVSGYGRHGYSYNGAVTDASGKSGRAGKFDGSNDYVVAPVDGTALRELTIELWVKPTGSQSNKNILRWTNNMSDAAFVTLERVSTSSPNTNIRWRVNNAPQSEITIPVDTWTHLAVTHDGTTWRFYKDGVYLSSYTGGRLYQSYAVNTYWGSGYTTSYSFSGYIDEAAVYGRALSDLEIKTRFQYPGLKNYGDTNVCENTTYTYQVKTMRKMSNPGGDYWTKRAPITITNFQPNYQTRVVVNYASYSPDMQADFRDIRFYDAAAGAELPYWVETKTDGSTATVWFRSGMSNNIYMYYGNPSSVSSSSSKRVFEVFDDFGDGSLAMWTPLSGNGAVSESGGALNFSYTGAEANDWTGTRQGKALRLEGLPMGDFHAQVKLNSYTVNTSTQAGLSVYGSDGSAYQFGRSYDGANNNTRLYQNSTYVASNTTSSLPLYLAVRRVGTSYNFYLSTNNSTWTLVGSTYSAVTFNNIVLFGREWGANDISFTMDDFIIRKYVSTQPTATAGTTPESPVLPATYFAFNEWETGYSNTAEAATSPKGSAPVLSASPYSESEIDLNWTHTQTDETGFRIEWCKVNTGAGIDCTQDSHFTANTPIEKAADTATHRHSGLEMGAMYKYRMVAYKTAFCGWTTDYSAVAEAMTIAPPAPSNLKAISINTTRVDLTWNDNTGTETGFTVQRCEKTGSVDCTVDADFTTIATPGVNSTSSVTIQDTGVCAGNTYRYRVKANNPAWPGGSTAWSNVAPAVTPAIGNILPDSDFENGTSSWSEMGPVTSFDTSTVYSGANSLKLSAAGVTLGRSQSVSVTPNRTYNLSGYLNTNMTAGKAQCDVQGAGIDSTGIVSTGNSGGWTSLLTDPVTIPAGTSTVNIRCFADGAPQGTAYFDVVQLVPVPVILLTATRVNETQINLSWDDNMSDNTGFDVLWCSGSTSCTPTSSLVSGITTTTQSHTNLAASTTYRYIVRGYKTASGCTGGRWTTDSNIADATTTVLAPDNLVAAAADTTTVNLSWNDNTASENQFKIQRCEGSATCTDFADFPNNTSTTASYQDTSVCKGTLYRYRVRAEKTTVPWYSDWSAETPNDSAQTPTPAAPSNPSAVAVTDTQIDVSWTDNTTDETRFDIEKCLDGVCDPPIPVDSASRGWTATTGARTYSVTGLLTSKNYCFRIKAYKTATCNGGWETDYTTPQVCDQTFSATPSGLTATAINSMKIQLGWDDISIDEDGFELEVQAWNGKWVLIATLGAGVTTYIDTMGIEPQKEYRYRVRAVRGADKSPYNEGSVTTPPYASGDNTCQYTILIQTAGAGSGSVTLSPSGLGCGTGCSAYWAGTSVTLTAIPDAGKTFTGWSGACSGASTCTVTMDADKQVTATFQ